MSGGGKHGGLTSAIERPEKQPEGEHGGVHEHLKALHEEMGGKHMHVHQHEGGMTSHQVGEDGEVEGPHEHESTEALKEHMAKFFDEEAHEPEHSGDHGDGLM